MAAKELRFTKHARRILHRAMTAAGQQGRDEIDTGDLLAALQENPPDQSRASNGRGDIQHFEALIPEGSENRDSVSQLPATLHLLLDEDGTVVRAFTPGQELLADHRDTVIHHVQRNTGPLTALTTGDREYVITTSRLTNGQTWASLFETTQIDQYLNSVDGTNRLFCQDMTSPISVITASVDILPKVTNLETHGLRLVEHIATAAHKLMNIRDLINEPRSPLFPWALRQVRCDLKCIVADAIRAVAKSNETASVDDAIPPGDWLVWGDEKRLTTMIERLIEHAVVRSPTGRPARMELGGDVTGMWLRLRDYGPSIEEIAHLFERRYGPPLKISPIVVAGLISRFHGLTIEAKNLPEGGAEIVVLFPKEIVVTAGVSD